MRVIFILFIYIISILTSNYNVQKNYAETVTTEQADVEEKQNYINKFNSDTITSTDYLEGNSGVNFLCENTNGENILKLGYLPQDNNFDYCKIECQNGRVQSNIISKYDTVDYFLNVNSIEGEYADRIAIACYDADGKLLCQGIKYIYWDSMQNTFYSSDLGKLY